jgi:hypothetical protein
MEMDGMIQIAPEIAATMARRMASRTATRASAIDRKTVATGKDRMRTSETTRFRPTRAGERLRILHARAIVSSHAFAATTTALAGRT